MKSLLFLGLLLCVVACQDQLPIPEYNIQKTVIASQAGIATAHPAATQIGLDILQQGGNAVDAAIATTFALAVCYPVAGNIGGGGFMVLRMADGTTDALDYRETAPAAADRDMYLDENGDVIRDLSTAGHLAAGVPGTVDGMVKAYERYSKLKDWSALIQPSIDLAAKGLLLTEREAAGLNRTKDRFVKYNTRTPRFVKVDGEWQTGEVLQQPELAEVLSAIRDQGHDGFYNGWVADSIVAEMERGGGIISQEDLAGYEAKWREPLIGEYNGYDIISMPPASSGGIALLQLLSSVEDRNIGDYTWHSLESIHLMVEAERRVYADRATHVGDADYWDVPVKGLIDEEYNRLRMSSFDPSVATDSETIYAGEPANGESEQTTHFSIVDAEGNAVSITTTINTGYGSKVVVGGAGFFLNNEMDDFSAKPGVPNFFGLLGNEANAIEPGKRMLSSMTPTIVARDGDLSMVVGTPGGSTIITSVFQTILNVLEWDMTASEAVQSCRFHHQWKPDAIIYERGCIDSITIQALQEMGHEFMERGNIGRVEAIVKLADGRLEVAADQRGDDTAMG
ncbi:MAG: gamma-glutamyltransferase, partial [Bacteroidota bacterium]